MVIDDYYYNTGIDRDMIADNQGFESAGMDGDMQVPHRLRVRGGGN